MTLIRKTPASRRRTQVELEIERRLNSIQSGYRQGDTSGIRLFGQVVDYKPVTVTSDYTATGREGQILVDATNGDVTITFPSAATMGYNIIPVRKIDSTRHKVTVKSAVLSETVQGDTKGAYVDVQNDTMSIVRQSATEFMVT